MSIVPGKEADSASRITTGNVLSQDVKITGTLKVREALLFNAAIDGQIISASHLVLGEHAAVTGQISAETLTLQGVVHGNISVTSRAELKVGSELHGDLTARQVAMEEGSIFIGQAKIVSGKG